MEEDLEVCPISITDSSINIANHLQCIQEANLGPANPSEPSDTFWSVMADKWLIPTEDARVRQCQNCDNYNNSPDMLECLQSSTFKASDLPINPPWADVDTSAGYCSKWNIICSATRTCATWEPEEDQGELDTGVDMEDQTQMSLSAPKLVKKVFTFESVLKAVDSGDSGDLRIEGYASTNAVDRSSDVILASAWTKSNGLNNFKANPILLFNHDYNMPVGKVIEMTTDSKGLLIKGIISKNAAGNVYNLVKEGVLTTFSVGFMIRDADYDKSKDGLIIKDAELLEISVVSVPCNQDATFSVAKSFDSQDDYLNFRKQFETALVGQPSAEHEGSSEGAQASRKSFKMNEELQTTIAAEVAKALAEKALAEKAAADKAIADKVSEKAAAEAATVKVVETAGERLYAELEKRFQDKEINLEKQLGDLKTELTEKSEELKAIANSKRVFSDRGASTEEWKKQFGADMEDAYLLARITGEGYNTKFAKNLLEKVNSFSSVQVSSDTFEREVNLNIERDIWLELVLAPLFREISMTSAAMTIPVAPDTNYASITSTANIPGTNPNGLLDVRGVAPGTGTGVQLTEIELRTIKMVAKTYLNNDTEEDALLPILPLLRDAMIRQHARGVENMILLGGHTDGAYPSITAAQGLLKYATTNSRTITAAGAATPLTAAALLGLRKNMGKYGLRPSDVVYIVSLQGYFELIEDAEFQDFNLVNQLATKLTGEVGQVFGSPVMVCDEFPAAATGKYLAAAVNKRNFVVPRQRGITVESQYLVENQHKVLATTQRLGFKEIIPNAKSVVALKYA
jgi:HK97 family phage prohead protease